MSEIDTRPRLYIEQAILKGFKSIDDLHIKLNPGLNILIGQNGSGKSNLLEFLNDAIYSMLRVFNLTLKSAQLILKSTNGDKINYQIKRIPTNKSHRFVNDDLFSEPFYQSLRVNDELAYDDGDERGGLQFKYKNKNIESSRYIWMIFHKIEQRFLSPSYIRYTFPKNLSGIEEPLLITMPFVDYGLFFEYDTDSKIIQDIVSYFEDVFINELNGNKKIPFLTSDNIIVLEKIEKIDLNYILERLIIDDNIISNLSKFTPIKNIRVNENINIFRDDKSLIIDNIRIDFFINDNWLPWSQLSDGTKRLFFIVSEISLRSDETILLEEPELGIHPHQFDLIMQFLKEQSATKQIIMSTHSPKALDILDKENLHRIFITKYEKGKGTTISNLNQQQKEKATMYMEEVGFLSDYWLLSDLEA